LPDRLRSLVSRVPGNRHAYPQLVWNEVTHAAEGV
jgi:hypothetical protein